MTEAQNIISIPLNSHFRIAEVEGPDDYFALLACLPQVHRSQNLAIVTNFAPFVTWDEEKQQWVDDPAKAKPLIDAGFKCLTEAYLGDNPNATPDRLNFRGTRLGWKKTAPVFGVWNYSDYEQWENWPGCSDYLLEYVI